MIGINPYKIHFDVIEHVDAINGSHKMISRASDEDQAQMERDIFLAGNPGKADKVVVYKTEVNAYGVVLGRERV